MHQWHRVILKIIRKERAKIIKEKEHIYSQNRGKDIQIMKEISFKVSQTHKLEVNSVTITEQVHLSIVNQPCRICSTRQSVKRK